MGHVAEGFSVRASEAKVGDLDLAPVVHEQVARLQVAVDDPVVVARGHGRQELEHEGLDLAREERGRHVGEEGLQVVFDKVHNDKDLSQGVADDDLADADNVFVRDRHEGLDLAQAGDREPVLLLVHFEFFQRDNVARRFAPRAEHDAVAPFLDLVQALRGVVLDQLPCDPR